MLKIGLVGLGFMGRTHLKNYIRLANEGLALEVVAICDIDPAKLSGGASAGNIDTKSTDIDLSRYHKYTDVAEMLAKEPLDVVDTALPTYLHSATAVQCLDAGLHVFSEKPMAFGRQECEDMIQAAERAGKQLMIGHCLRFWPAYGYLKQAVAKKTFGEVLGGTFFRGGGTPTWAEWLLKKEKSGGVLWDMHVHDVDVVQWLFGKPDAVSCIARNVIPGSGYDIVSTHYRYKDGKVVNAQADWTLQGDHGFTMNFRVNFEHGNIVFEGNRLTVNPDNAASFVPQLSPEIGYYHELKYFVNVLLANGQVMEAAPREIIGSIALIEAENLSADREGAWVQV